MAKQDDYARYTIRIPADLYERLKEAAGEKSVNAEIIARLQGSFPSDDAKLIEGRRPTKAEVDAALRVLEHLKFYAHEILVDEDVLAKGKK